MAKHSSIYMTILIASIVMLNNGIVYAQDTQSCRVLCAIYFPVGSQEYNDCVYCCTHDCNRRNTNDTRNERCKRELNYCIDRVSANLTGASAGLFNLSDCEKNYNKCIGR